MNRRIMHAALGATAAVAASGLVLSLSSSPASAETIEISLHDAVDQLEVAAEEPDGYDRDKFPHWVADDRDGCNARYEVLIAEAVEPPTVGDGCELSGGKWFSYFDAVELTDTSDVSIDHFVPLAEAWRSGARDWSTEDRQRFANDLGDERTLVGVTISSNSSKGDSDPSDWMPDNEQCRYLTEWAVTKTRWRLPADEDEKSFLTSAVAECPNDTLTIEYAM
ncbi:MAG: HNH endonuclease family protein [Stackebrandtia sp.]